MLVDSVKTIFFINKHYTCKNTLKNDEYWSIVDQHCNMKYKSSKMPWCGVCYVILENNL